jgi:AcrR family transcriptional regulator
MARTGRRPGNTATSDEILEAARTLFGDLGFDKTTIRGIAGAAGVDPALVHHYFGTKADLYAAAISVPIAPSTVTRHILADGIEHAGRRIAETFITVWEDPAAREPLLGMIRGAMGGHDAGSAAFREFITAALLHPIAAQINAPDARLRAELAAAQLVGMAILRYVVEVEPLATAPPDAIIDQIAPRIQQYLSG